MKTSFSARCWKIAKWYILAFVLLFVFRLTYGYIGRDERVNTDLEGDFFSNISNLRKNYASEKLQIADQANFQGSAASSQKFEKTASIRSTSYKMEEDEKNIKQLTDKFNAIIQYEQHLGRKGNKELHLMIGVNPALFDSFQVIMQKIGEIRSIEITKIDKTNEFRQLNATKASIEKTLNSLNDLKSKGGQISDFVSLSEKILEVEQRLQSLGVELGNFDSVNEFCTVRISLFEGKQKTGISFLHRVKVALEWTIQYFGILVLISVGLIISIFILLVIIERLKILQLINHNPS